MMPIVAAIQMNSTDQISENLEAAAQLIAEAASKQAVMVTLPEMFAVVTNELSVTMAAAEDYQNGVIQNFLATQAAQHGIWLVGGTIPIKQPGSDKVFAACLLYNPQGLLVARYNKIHLFDVTLSAAERYQESATIAPGHSIVVQETPIGKLGLAVCYDIRFPELFRAMFNQEVEIFAVPAAFTVTTGKAHWEVLIRSRAIENFSYLIGACQAGTHSNGRQTFGHSAIVSPWGEILAMASSDEVGVITAPIDLNYLHEIRKKIPVKEHQRI